MSPLISSYLKSRVDQDDDEETNYYDHFFQAFDRSVVQKRDIDFIMDLCSRLELLVEDDELTADELKKLAP